MKLTQKSEKSYFCIFPNGYASLGLVNFKIFYWLCKEFYLLTNIYELTILLVSFRTG